MVESTAVAKRRSRAPFVAALLAAIALWAKRSYPKASLFALAKRLIGFLLGRVLPIPTPQVLDGRGSQSKIGGCIQTRGCKKALIVTDEVLVKLGMVQKCIDSLSAAGVQHTIFDKVEPNPPYTSVEAGYKLYNSSGCDCIIAIGGGSPMDTAKVIGAKVCNPRPIESFEGPFKATMAGLRKLPLLVAVPTTAGTGSETTIAAIITIPEKKKKVNIMDLGLVPSVAVLDPEIVEKLPKHITAATGMDALTHAIESYISGWASSFTKPIALEAVTKIFRSMQPSYDNGADMVARGEMLDASFKAGLSFTRANVGYVHAIAHQLGALFHTPHGDANAMLLPYVLDFYLEDEKNESGGSACIDKYCELAMAGGLVKSVPADKSSKLKLAESLVQRIRAMNGHMNIPKSVAKMNSTDVAEVATRALKEAHGELHSKFSRPLDYWLDLGYPTPKYMTQTECESIVRKVLPVSDGL